MDSRTAKLQLIKRNRFPRHLPLRMSFIRNEKKSPHFHPRTKEKRKRESGRKPSSTIDTRDPHLALIYRGVHLVFPEHAVANDPSNCGARMKIDELRDWLRPAVRWLAPSALHFFIFFVSFFFLLLPPSEYSVKGRIIRV